MTDRQIQQALGYPGDIAELRNAVENICESAAANEDLTLDEMIDQDLIDVSQDDAGDWYVAVYSPIGEAIGLEYLENEQE